MTEKQSLFPLTFCIRDALQVSFYFEPRDLWVGVYWNREESGDQTETSVQNTVYVCLLPMLPIRFMWFSGQSSA